MFELDEWVATLVVDSSFLLLVICDLANKPVKELAERFIDKAEGVPPVGLEAYHRVL